MRILLINPPAENTVIENPSEEGDEFLEVDSFGDFPPLGALYVLSYLEANSTGHQFSFIDCVAEGISHVNLIGRIAEIHPDVVGVTSFTVGLVDVIKVARSVRRIVPDAHICLGGHHPIAYPFEATQLKEFDSVVVGEGEIAFTELVRALEEGEDFTAIKGVYTVRSIEKFRTAPVRDKRFLARVTVPVAYVEDLDSLPMVNRKYIRHLKYRNIIGVSSDLATVLSSRGCPYQCTFCDVPFKRYRQRSVEKVVDEVEACLEMGYREIRFYDDLFNIKPAKVIAFCDEVERRGLVFPWDFRGRVNGIDRASLVKAKANGLRMISFGVETGTDEGLRALKKGTNTDKIREAFRLSRELGIKTVADFIIGLPHEKTVADVERNLKFMRDLDPDYAQISILKLYPNTHIYEQAVKLGIVEPGLWQEFVLNPRRDFLVDHWEESFDLQTLIDLQKKAYRRFYFRPVYIMRSLLATRSLYEFTSKFGGVLKLLGINNPNKRYT